jgi:isoleucyl-tRNA synthetase
MIKVRQPLQKVMIPALDATFRAEIEAVADLIKQEVNVKEILDDALGLVKQIKPISKHLTSFLERYGLILKRYSFFKEQTTN